MTLQLINLDDRTYADLVGEAQAMIPHLQREWTNHNPSDPGIMLIELFAWLTEMVLFQLNEVTDHQTELFLEILNGPDWQRPPGTDLDSAVRASILALRDRYRAVTADDFIYLIKDKWPQTETAQALTAEGVIPAADRLHCLPELEVMPDGGLQSTPGHISIVVMPAPANEEVQNSRLLEALWNYLDDRCLLAVQHHLILPEYKPVVVRASLYLRADAPARDTLVAARQALRSFFDPRQGGDEKVGWPFGRSVYASEVYAVLNQIDLIDFVEDVALVNSDGVTHPVELPLDPYQLVEIQVDQLTAVDHLGGRFQWDVQSNQALRIDEGA